MPDRGESYNDIIAQINASEQAIDAYIRDNEANVTIPDWLEAEAGPFGRKILQLKLELDMARTIRQKEPELASKIETPFKNFKDPLSRRLLGDLILGRTYWVKREDTDTLFRVASVCLVSMAEALDLQEKDAVEKAMKNRDIEAAITAKDGFDAFRKTGAQELGASQILLRLLQDKTYFSDMN